MRSLPWPCLGHAAPVTVAGPRRTCTGFPFEPHVRGHHQAEIGLVKEPPWNCGRTFYGCPLLYAGEGPASISVELSGTSKEISYW